MEYELHSWDRVDRTWGVTNCKTERDYPETGREGSSVESHLKSDREKGGSKEPRERRGRSEEKSRTV